jgi:threonyl-tRNA synthetase
MPAVAREDPSYRLRHSAAHVLAQAVKEMFPGAKLAWGPPHDRFENGFYYDFDLPRALTPEDFPEIEGRMRRIIEEDHPFRYRLVGVEEARELFSDPLLIEHHAGALPVWLAPTQAVVIPVSDGNLAYADEVASELAAAGFRAEVDGRPERMNAKIRDAQLQKIPYMLVGNREEEARGVSVRLRTNENRGMTGLPGFVDRLREVVESKGGP